MPPWAWLTSLWARNASMGMVVTVNFSTSVSVSSPGSRTSCGSTIQIYHHISSYSADTQPELHWTLCCSCTYPALSVCLGSYISLLSANCGSGCASIACSDRLNWRPLTARGPYPSFSYPSDAYETA